MEKDNNQIKRQKIYLAALLHDIGKFYQRASASFEAKNNNLSEQSRKIRDYICPKNKHGNFTHLHVIWTNEFFEQKKDIFNNIRIDNEKPFFINPWDKDKTNEDNIANLASNHHKPRSDHQKLITIADWWSAGIDRVDAGEEDKEIKKHNLKFSNFKEVPLFSIFNILRAGKDKADGNQNIAHQLTKLSLNETEIFPKEIKQEDVVSLEAKYAKLWERFTEEFDNLPTDSYTGFEESLLFLLKKYTWAIPSNTMDMANVSLFDHLKTTASIADCLYVAEKDIEFKNAFDFSGDYPKIQKGYFPVMLLGVDISGIQNFIYDIASSKAAKSLKGRSFYLQLLAEAMLMKFKKHPDIQARSAHVLYASGGKFYLLLPNTMIVKNAVNEIKQQTEEILWKEHNAKLSVNISHTAFACFSEKRNNNWVNWVEIEGRKDIELQLKDLWKDLSDKITKQKEQKFKDFITGNFDAFFNEKDKELVVGGDSKTCIVTGEEFKKDEKQQYLDDDKEKPVKKYVFEQTELGSSLKDADYLISFKGEIEDDKYLNNRAKAKITVLDTNFYLFDDLELIKDEADFRTITSADVSSVYMINKFNFLDAQIKGQRVSYGFQFYGGNEQAYHRDEKGNIIYRRKLRGDVEHTYKQEKTFNELAKTDDSKSSLLGVLRMDVDNLGKLFIQGFHEKQMSFSAFSTLSFHLDLFFSGYLNSLRNITIEKDKNNHDKIDKNGNKIYKYREWVNILYSGGDDLFVVGRWDKVIDFAEEVRRKFNKYTKRDEIGLSAGIAIVHEKFPISKAAEMAGEAESASKSFHPGEPGWDKQKDAITFFGETISWKDEFEEVKKIKDKLVEYINSEEKPLSKAILHKLIQYRLVKDKHLVYDKPEHDNKRDYSFLWHTAYYFKRYSEKYDKKKNEHERDIFEFLNNELKDKLFSSSQNNYRYYELAALAARWAEMELKYEADLTE